MALPTVALTFPGIGQRPSGIAYDPVQNQLYVANFSGESVAVINASTGGVLFRTPVPGTPEWVAALPLNEDRSRAFVTTRLSASVVAIDGTTWQVIGNPIMLDAFAGGIAANPRTRLVYVTIPNRNIVTVINGVLNTLAGVNIQVGRVPMGVDVNPETNCIYVANSGSSNVSVIDGNRHEIIGVVGIGGSPTGVGVDTDRNRIFVTDSTGNSVTIIDGESLQILAVVPVGTRPIGVAVNPSTGHVFVANMGDHTVSVIEDLAVIATLPVGMGPRGVAVKPDMNLVYVTNFDGDSLTSINDSTDPPTDGVAMRFASVGIVAAAPAAMAQMGVTHVLTTPAGNLLLRPINALARQTLAALLGRRARVTGVMQGLVMLVDFVWPLG